MMKGTIYTGIAVLAALTMAAGCGGNSGNGGSMGGDSTEEAVLEDRRDPLWGFVTDSLEVTESKVRKGDFFATILMRSGLSAQEAYNLSEACDSIFDLRSIRIGNAYRTWTSVQDSLEYLAYDIDRIRSVVFRCREPYDAYYVEKPILTETKSVDVTIESSLWNDMLAADAPPVLILTLSDIYAWTVDFFGLQKGDRFQVIYDENSREEPKKVIDRREYQIQKPPEQIVCGIYNEFVVNGETLIYDGEAYLRFANLGQPGADTLHFQVTDSPRLLIKQVSFLNNYVRAAFTTALGIFALGLIASSAAAFLSMPTAVFITLSYVLTGMFSSYIISSIDATSEGIDVNLLDAIGTYTGRVMMSLLIPVQSFFVSGSLATGELIEYSLIAHLLIFNIILKGLPLCLLGIYLYWRREAALAMKQ